MNKKEDNFKNVHKLSTKNKNKAYFDSMQYISKYKSLSNILKIPKKKNKMQSEINSHTQNTKTSKYILPNQFSKRKEYRFSNDFVMKQNRFTSLINGTFTRILKSEEENKMKNIVREIRSQPKLINVTT